MKRNAIAILIAASLPLAAHADSYTIDPPHTFANFSISHMGFSTMHGRFDKSSGKVTLDRAAKTGSVDIAIETASVSTGFAKRDDHLKSPDFFNAAEFPTITYKSSAVKFKGDNPASVEGNLTMAGVTKPVTLTIDAIKCDTNPMNKKYECGVDASAQIKRSDFGVKYGLPGVGDDIKLVFEVEAYKD
ncbi:MAG: polyisoprenoid-binding protein [Nitrosomonadales bacterium]|nr:polyisoprenoid-binding protein [Nitrosomonadales bacterium]